MADSLMRNCAARALAQTTEEWVEEYSTGVVVTPVAWQGDTKPFNHMTILPDGSGAKTGDAAEIYFANLLSQKGLYFEQVGKSKGPFDFVCSSRDGTRITIDVKAKLRNVKAQPYHDAHVTCDQMNYDCRLYVFASVTGGEVELMGWCGKSEFWNNCRIVRRGEKDGPFVEKVDAGKMQHKELRQMNRLWGFLK